MSRTVAANEDPSPRHASIFAPENTARRSWERYEVLGEHGRGGLGRVSRAHDRELDRDVAIKELLNRTHISEVRFFREALITARLEHPGIVPVHEAGRWSDGTPFYAMKLVAGRPLRDLIAERHTVAQRLELLHHVIAVADAISYAHGRNIIHRDLKPANIIVGDFGETVVIDWGLAKDLSTSDEPSLTDSGTRAPPHGELTSTGSVLGTPAYMAPEQERGERVDQRADVFAIGAMLWELCALQKVPPSDRRQRRRLLRRSNIDHDLITIIDKAIDIDPSRRYPNAASLASDLKAFKSGARIAARDYSLAAMLAHWVRRHRTLASAAVVALLATIGATGAYVHNIAAQRDRAESAEHALEHEHDELVLKHVEIELAKDPSAAVDTLATYHGKRDERVRQLLAEASGRGIATLRAVPHSNYVSWATGTPHDGVVTLGADGALTRTRSPQDITVLTRDVAPIPLHSYCSTTQTLAYLCGATQLCLFDIATNSKTLTDVEGAGDAIMNIEFSPQGNKLGVIRNSGELQIFDVIGQRLRLARHHTFRENSALFFFSDTSVVVSGDDGLAAIDDDDDVKSLPLADTTFWDKDVSRLLLAQATLKGELLVIDATNLMIRHRQAVCPGPVSGTRFVPRHNLLAYICEDGLMASLDLSTWQTTTFARLSGSASALTVDDAGTFVIATGGDRSVNVVDLDTHIVTTYRGGDYRVVSIQPPSNGFPYIIAGDVHGGIRVWPRPQRYATARHKATGRFWAAAASPDRLFATTTLGQLIALPSEPSGGATSVRVSDDLLLAMSPQGDVFATAGMSGAIRFWSTTTLTLLRTRDGQSGRIGQLTFLRDGTLLTSDHSGQLFHWTDEAQSPLIDHRAAAISMFAVADESHVVIEATADGLLWSRRLGQEFDARQLELDSIRVTAMTALSDGATVLVGRANGSVLAIYTRSNKIRTLLAEGEAIREIVNSPDGQHVAISTNGERVYWGAARDIFNTAPRIQWRAFAASGRRIAFGDDKTLVVACPDGGIWLYSIADQAMLFVALGPINPALVIPSPKGSGVDVFDAEGDIIWIDLRQTNAAMDHVRKEDKR